MNTDSQASFSPPNLENVVSDRSYQTVLDELSASEHIFDNRKVLSVGEGLSGFTNGLADRGVDVTAADPIYADDELLQNAPQHGGMISPTVKFLSFRRENELFNPPDKKKVKLVAKSTESWRIRDGEFQLVVANRLYEHVDMSRVLPEMLRVVNSSQGELRMGGLPLHCIPKDGKLTTGIFEKDMGIFIFSSNEGFAKSLKDLAQKYPEVSMYAVVGDPSRYPIIYENTGAHLVRTLIFVKGNMTPEISSKREHNNSHYVNKLYKIDPQTLNMSEIL